MLRDYLAGQARLRGIPLRHRIVLALAAAEADQVPVAASLRDLAEATGVTDFRWLREEIRSLERMRMISRAPGTGTRPNTFRLRSEDEWLEAPWAGDRRASLASVASIRTSRRNRQAVVSRAVTGTLGPYQRASDTRALGALARSPHPLSSGSSAQSSLARYEGPSAQFSPAHKPDDDRGAHCSPDEEVNLLLGEEEEGGVATTDGTDAAAKLVAAVERATGKTLYGRPLSQLEDAGLRANGNLDAMLAAASRPGPAGFPLRIAEIVAIAEGTRVRDVVGPVDEAPPAKREDPRRREWIQALAAARLSGEEDLAREAQAMLDSMGP